MTEDFETIIIGAGPGGLACAGTLAAAGHKVLVVERNQEIGPKICAGGITWSGLLARVPETLIERSFPEQRIFSNLQRIRIRENNPIIATVNRRKLGQWMAADAAGKGAEILTGMRAVEITKDSVALKGRTGIRSTLRCRHVVGADGTQSLVRRFCGLPAGKRGPGINYQVEGSYPDMEWHLKSRLFNCGYAWIFPHRETTSIGAYCPAGAIPAATLKQNCIRWARTRGFDLEAEPCQAALISYDYQGFRFGSRWLVGDAAGLASGLTGEGIYPAIISGEEVAKSILNPAYRGRTIDNMVQRQRLHQRVVNLAGRNRTAGWLLMEVLVLCLRCRLINFHALEMGQTG